MPARTYERTEYIVYAYICACTRRRWTAICGIRRFTIKTYATRAHRLARESRCSRFAVVLGTDDGLYDVTTILKSIRLAAAAAAVVILHLSAVNARMFFFFH